MATQFIPTMDEAEHEVSDQDLLASALEDAVAARQSGLIVGPEVDEVALQRAARCARRRDAVRAWQTPRGAA